MIFHIYKYTKKYSISEIPLTELRENSSYKACFKLTIIELHSF